MGAGWAAFTISLAYMCVLFGIALYGDMTGRQFVNPRVRAAIYALGLCIYCTSWTFFGSVGLATTSGWDFVPVYTGPILVFTLGRKLVARVLRLSKAQNITSIADFLAARYGKSEAVAALVAIIAVIGVLPYIALQLKAIAEALALVAPGISSEPLVIGQDHKWQIAAVAGALLGLFAMAFGTRRVEATEHQDGLMLAIATESVLKLLTFLIIGFYITFILCDGLGDIGRQLTANPPVASVFLRWPDPGYWITVTLLSASAVLLLPRQFHVAIVENRSESDLRTASWLFPLFLLLINLFVVPVAVAGLAYVPDTSINRDMTILALPLGAKSYGIAILGMLGGFSAAAAMVIDSSVALSIMVSNDLIIPLFLRMRRDYANAGTGDISGQILLVRRFSIAVVIGLGWFYYTLSQDRALAAMGLMSFAAIAQLAPAFVFGMFWHRGNARGAIAGLVSGICVWAYVLLLPSLEHDSGLLRDLVANGPGGLAFLKPTALFGVDLPMLTHGVIFSLGVNIACFAGFSLTRTATPIEALQSSIFVSGAPVQTEARYRPWRAALSWGELESIVARYLGVDRARTLFADIASKRSPEPGQDAQADMQTMRVADQTLTSVIGAASARLVLSQALQRRNLPYRAAQELADQASAAIHYNRDLLQHAIDFARQGISIFDADLRLVFWNREFRDIFGYTPEQMQVGTRMDDLIRFNARRGIYGAGSVDEYVAARHKLLVNTVEPFRLAFPERGLVVELRAQRMPDGGLVVTYTDVSEQVETEQALASINETLERRVQERTEELVALNGELGRAKAAAEEANLSKTRFLAAASHDILQPLNAARLFATALAERMPTDKGLTRAQSDEARELANNVDASLESVEEILTTLLDMSRLDAGAMKPELTPFRIEDILGQLRLEFEPMAKEKNLKLTFAPSSATIRSDRRLLRRLLQHLISNAIKYTPEGRVLVGCRHRRSRLLIEVWDTGLGIPDNKRKAVFREFERLDSGARRASGLGLGLSIVERLARVLNLKVNLRSQPGKGSVFSVEVPMAPALPVPAASTGGGGGRARHQPLVGMIVVTIDNEPLILEGMKLLLGGWGCKVIAAESMKQAEAVLTADKLVPSAIIADYHLDETGGIDSIVALRWKFGADIPAILLTADRSQSVRLEAESKNIRLLNKPLKPAALRSLLAQWLVSRVAAE